MEDRITTYVQRLRAALRPLPPETQAEILAELESHMAEGLADERLGQDRRQREVAVMREMGNPDELGYEMQRVSGRRRWLDFLLAAVPALFVLRILENLLAALPAPAFLPPLSGIALALLPLCLLMLAVAQRRRADGLLIFWLWMGLDLVLAAWQWAGVGRPAFPFALLWGAVALAGFGWLLRVLWRVRRVPLLLCWGVLPLLFWLLQLPPLAKAAAILKVTLFGNPGAGAPLPAAAGWQGALWLEAGLSLLALGLFFAGSRRWLRWSGLALFVLAPAVAKTTFWGVAAAGTPLIAALPLTFLALAAGLLAERRRRERLAPA